MLVEFVRAQTTVRSPPLVPEVRLHLADEVFGLWETVEAGLGRLGSTLPFWAFGWPGGQALARYVLDHPDVVAGRTVLDLASGSGLVAIAAAKAGAAAVTSCDVDDLAATAITLNAELNGVGLTVLLEDILDRDGGDAEVVLAGDVFYEHDLANRVLPFLDRCRANGSLVLIGDPHRAYLPTAHLEPLATYQVPDARALEDTDLKPAAVFRLGAHN